MERIGEIQEDTAIELEALRRRVAELERPGNECKRAEVALQESEAKFRSVAETTVSTILIYPSTLQICRCRY